MNKEEIRVLLTKDLENASQVNAVIGTKGWNLFEKIVDNKKKELNQISDIKTLEELKGRKIAIKVIEDIFDEFKGILNTGIKAKNDLDKLDSTN